MIQMLCKKLWSWFWDLFYWIVWDIRRFWGVWIVIAIFAVLMLFPDQTGEALRVLYSDRLVAMGLEKLGSPLPRWDQAIAYMSWGTMFSLLLLTLVIWLYAFNALANREIIKPVRKSSDCTLLLRVFIMAVGSAAFYFILFGSLEKARPGAEFTIPNLSELLHKSAIIFAVAGAIVFALSLYIFHIARLRTDNITGIRKWPHNFPPAFYPIVMTVVTIISYLWLWYQSAPTVFGVVIVWATLLLTVLGWLAWLSKITRAPLVLLVFALPIIFSLLGLNRHNIVNYYLVGQDTPDVNPIPDARNVNPILDAREAFKIWREYQKNKYPDSTGPIPMFIVATEGGGMRANVMTAMVLDELRARFPNFNDHLFAIIGVSGGSLGAANYVAAIHTNKPAKFAYDTLCSQPKQDGDCMETGVVPFSDNWQKSLHADLLTPTMQSMLGLDWLMNWMPFISSEKLSRFDRARALENAWADAWLAGTSNNDLRKLGFREVGCARGKPWEPCLILLTTRVQDGQPFAISHLNGFGITTLADSDPKIDVPLTTAAVMSARFPIITPPARLPFELPVSKDPWQKPQPVDLVDGGYYENSGLTVATHLIRTLMKENDAPQSDDKIPAVAITFIYISNGDVEVTDPDKDIHFLPAPVTALYNSRDAHGDEVKWNFDSALTEPINEICKNQRCPAIKSVSSRMVALRPPIFKKVSVPLGWALGPDSRKEIALQLCSIFNTGIFAEIKDILPAEKDTGTHTSSTSSKASTPYIPCGEMSKVNVSVTERKKLLEDLQHNPDPEVRRKLYTEFQNNISDPEIQAILDEIQMYPADEFTTPEANRALIAFQLYVAKQIPLADPTYPTLFSFITHCATRPDYIWTVYPDLFANFDYRLNLNRLNLDKNIWENTEVAITFGLDENNGSVRSSRPGLSSSILKDPDFMKHYGLSCSK
ncbi:MAG: patatin-like phospholipase family protein [Methylobacillus sp.]|jgi:hypothetical protein|nr:patatin-like phospholipase family protein [Methylobacillus sp.]